MATRTRTETICDYPGCDRRLTELGGKMALTPDGPAALAGDSDSPAADLCREHRRSFESWWNRGEKAGEQPSEQPSVHDERDETTTAPARAQA